MRHSLSALAAFAGACYAQSTFSPLKPPAIPLAVRSPYMNTWQQAGSDGGNGGYLAGEWPSFWMGQLTGWSGFVRVDNVTYNWLGGSNQTSVFVDQTSFEYTATKSIFKMNAGGYVNMTVTFMSPVVPDDLMRASLPYTYMNVEVISADGVQHDVQLYTDISAEWVSGDRSATAQWSYGTVAQSPAPIAPSPQASSAPSSSAVTTTTVTKTAQSEQIFGTQTAYALSTDYARTFRPVHMTGAEASRPTNFHPGNHHPRDFSAIRREAGGIAYHEVWRQQQLNFSETNQQADWGYWYYATENTANLTHQSGADVDVRGQFIDNGVLANTEDSDYRAINDAFPTFGFAVDLGMVGNCSTHSLFQLSLNQHDCVQFEGANGNETVPCLWTSYFDSNTAAVGYFFEDYKDGDVIASAFDKKVASDSNAAGGADYASLTALAARQAFGALSFTNTPSSPWVFLKEISSDGNIQTVDVIFPFHPIAIYLNPTLLRYMLDPLFVNQEAGYWPFAFSIHDLGFSYPNATGHNDGNDEMQPLEECGDMIIMTLAYAQRTGDNAYLAQHYPILKQWNEYLVQEALVPANQISTDDFATNLALKGIIGIEAFAQIANRTGHAADGANYTQIAHNYITQWQTLGITNDTTTPHAELSYGNSSSYVLLYNLYTDAELGLQLVPQSVYDLQSAFYPTVFGEFGVPLDTRHSYTKSDWELFCAAVASTSTRQQFISTVAKWTGETSTNFAWTDLYDTVTGDYPVGTGVFIARPVVGGLYSLLALNGAPTSVYVTPS
ncbi:hypothetical protein LTR97_005352 [Elasticomyces elasticus]|uniref:Glutaminase n=1 Tax=Elasticomyces elasticus TaxID=574655 RepID=A0AAN7W6Y6_9PEZI|nr:hypothetical protein LTR97_005352 [Elasticomyces elasticus]